MSDMCAHCVGHCDRKTSIAKLRFRNSDPDKMFRSLPQFNVWARTRNEAGVSNVCMTQILCFGPSYEGSPPGGNYLLVFVFPLYFIERLSSLSWCISVNNETILTRFHIRVEEEYYNSPIVTRKISYAAYLSRFCVENEVHFCKQSETCIQTVVVPFGKSLQSRKLVHRLHSNNL